MKFYRKTNFNKTILDNKGKKYTSKKGSFYYTDFKSNYSIQDMKDGNFYICSLMEGATVLSNSCLYVKKNGKLFLNKESFWESTNGDDLDLNNYKLYNPTDIPKDLKCFYKIYLNDYIDEYGNYFDQFNPLNF